MQKEELEYAVQRIEHMEKIFDEVSSAFKNDADFFKNEPIQRKVSLLTQYMESGQLLRDFALDEKGELPTDLKRGILSEDSLYNLITGIEKQRKKANSPFGKILSVFSKK